MKRLLVVFTLALLWANPVTATVPYPDGTAVVKFTLANQNIKGEILSTNPAGPRQLVVVWECGRQGVPYGIANFGRMWVYRSSPNPLGWSSAWFRNSYLSPVGCSAGDSGVTVFPFPGEVGDSIYFQVQGEVYRSLFHGDLRLIYVDGEMVLQ